MERDLGREIAEVMGGHLRCEECGNIQELGNICEYLGSRWPRCCGVTMRWVTARELEGEEK